MIFEPGNLSETVLLLNFETVAIPGYAMSAYAIAGTFAKSLFLRVLECSETLAFPKAFRKRLKWYRTRVTGSLHEDDYSSFIWEARIIPLDHNRIIQRIIFCFNI